MSEKPLSSEKQKKTQVKKIHFNFQESKTLEDWVALISDEENAPLGAHVVKLINSNVSDPNLNFEEAQKILEKSLLKNKLLRIADTVYLNPVGTTLNSIQRAIVILGFQSLRNIGLILAIYNHLVDISNDENLLREIAYSIHAALLSALIAQRKSKILNSEPIVVATLSYSLGKILFQFFGGETAKQYNELIENAPIEVDAEKELIGFLVKDLSTELAKRWNLGNLSQNIYEKPNPENIINASLLALEVADTLRKGWENDSAIESMKKLESYLGCTSSDVHSILLESIQDGLEEVALFNIPRLIDFIPLPVAEEEIDDEDHDDKEQVLPISSRIKATIQQLSILVSGRNTPSVNDVMSVGLKGIYDGVDFDRVLFALLSADRTKLNVKSIFEKQKSDLLQNFHFELTAPEGWLFQHILREQRSAWLGGKSEVVLKKYRNSDFNRRIGKGQFFAAPLILDGRAIGVYYADRQVSSRMLDTRSYDAFSELCTSINETIELIRKREKQTK